MRIESDLKQNLAAGKTGEGILDLGTLPNEAAQGEKIEAGVRQLVEAEMKIREEAAAPAKEEKASTKKEEKSQDTAPLSEPGKRIAKSLAGKENLLWVLEMELESWEALLNWQPSYSGGNADIAMELDRLAELYLKLWTAIMENTTGAQQTSQLGRLNQALSSVLNRILNSSLGDLTQFFEKHGGSQSAENVKSSVYYRVTGQTLSPRDSQAFWRAGRNAAVKGQILPAWQENGKTEDSVGGSRGSFRQGSSRAFVSGETAGGDLFRVGTEKEGAGSISNLKAGSANIKSMGTASEGILISSGKGEPGKTGGTWLAAEGQGAGRGYSAYRMQAQNNPSAVRGSAINQAPGVQATVTRGKGAIYSIGDMQKAQAFFEHLTGEGNLFQSPQITARNEEVLGCLYAVEMMKGQTFSAYSGVSKDMGIAVRTAVDKMVDYYLSAVEQDVERQQPKAPLKRNDVYKVYYQVMEQLSQKTPPEEAIEKGVEYAAQVFDEKKGMAGERKGIRYSEFAGFFQARTDIASESASRNAGIRFLLKDWKRYLHSIGMGEGSSYKSEFHKMSPWGIITPPDKQKKHVNKTELFWAGVAAMAVILFMAIFSR